MLLLLPQWVEMNSKGVFKFTHDIFSIFVQKLISCFLKGPMLSNYSRVPNRVRFIIYNDFSHDYDLFLTDYDLTWHYSLPIKGGYVYLFRQKISWLRLFDILHQFSTLEYDKNYERKWKSKKKIWCTIYRNILEYFLKCCCIKIRMVRQKLFQLIVAIKGETRRGRRTKKSAKIRRKNQFSNGHIEIRPG